jgi:hypothetical protein
VPHVLSEVQLSVQKTPLVGHIAGDTQAANCELELVEQGSPILPAVPAQMDAVLLP